MSTKDKQAAAFVDEEAADAADMKPMPISDGQDASNGSSWGEWLFNRAGGTQHVILPRRYKLITDGNYRKHSMWTLYFAILTSAISTKMLNPNYAIMCSGEHPDSFPSIEPFGFNSATYFIPMCSLLGVAISSTLVGKLSDKVGRKQPLLWMSIISFAGNIVKYYTSNEFWPFCISNFVFGFFLGNLPVGMAYIGDIFTKKMDKEKNLGMLVGIFVTGNAGGGMIAILMSESGLFAPLWVGAGLCLVSAILIAQFLIEPGDERIAEDPASLKDDDDDEFNNAQRPEKIDQRAMWNVIFGALADNFGSTALFPMCLSPLALEKYTLDFINAGQDPIMSVSGYQWLSVCVALLVIPATLITPHVFARIGPSGCCVFGNVFTGFLTMALLFIAGYAPATELAYGFFVAVLYGG